MKRKDEDRLVRLAFGDLSLEESATLERRASGDPEAKKRLAEYRTLRDELKNLAEVPPHQMSNERLREAILGQGLKPKAAEPIWNWLWMPASVACLVAIGFMYVQRHRAVEPTLVGLNEPGVTATADNPGLEWKPAIEHVASAQNPVKGPEKAVAHPALRLVADNHPMHARTHRRHVRHPDLGGLFTETMGGNDGSGADAHAGPSSPSEVAMTDQPLKPVDNDPSPPVVLIDAETDQNTGASKATEVGSGKNVIVGG